jgi:uncharacterized protein YbjQ (UPF0145 family)
MEIFLEYINVIVFITLIAVGYVAGSITERRHYDSILSREKETLRFPVVSAEGRFPEKGVKESFMVSGSVVISIDYFKRLLGNLRNLFGGRVKSYESLLDRARREAILRMKEEAQAKGAMMIVNLRMETSTLAGSANKKGQIGSVEVLAYGTAVIFTTR